MTWTRAPSLRLIFGIVMLIVAGGVAAAICGLSPTGLMLAVAWWQFMGALEVLAGERFKSFPTSILRHSHSSGVVVPVRAGLCGARRRLSPE
jgi:hypothetical protein